MLKLRQLKCRITELNKERFTGNADIAIQRTVEMQVCSYFDITPEYLPAKRKVHAVAMPRQMLFFLLWYYTDFSLKEIGKLYGKRDHTTVIHAVNSIEDTVTQKAPTPEKEEFILFLKQHKYLAEEVTDMEEVATSFVIDSYY